MYTNLYYFSFSFIKQVTLYSLTFILFTYSAFTYNKQYNISLQNFTLYPYLPQLKH